MERSNILGQREATLADAPVSLPNDAAQDWVNGFNTCRDRMLGHSDAFRAEIQRLREQNQRLQAKCDALVLVLNAENAAGNDGGNWSWKS